jgi:hypothetical protein
VTDTTINGTAVQEVADLAQRAADAAGKTVVINDVTYATEALHQVEPKKKDLPQSLGLTTLQALVDYLHANRDEVKLNDVVVHVVGPRDVRVLGALDEHNRRAPFAHVTGPDRLAGGLITFGSYADTERMNIALQTMFVPTQERAEVLRLVGTVKAEGSMQQSDDGVSQTVTARAGVALVAEVKVPNPVNLAPYRTFPEVEQPASPFVLRLKKGENGVLAALFEADGAGWTSVAVASVAEWLKARVPEGVAVLG